MAHLLRSRFQRGIAAVAIIALAVAAVAASALLIPQSTAEAGSPAAGMNQAVSFCTVA